MRQFSEYAHFGTLEIGPPEKPEPNHAALREADRVLYSTLLKEQRWSDDDFSKAKSYGFPDPSSYAFSGLVHVRREPIYSRRQINAWRERFLAFAGKVK